MNANSFWLWLQILLPPLEFVVVAMHHVPGRPATVEISGVADELGRHLLLLESRVHLLGFLNGKAAVGFSVDEQRGRLHFRRIRERGLRAHPVGAFPFPR